MRKITNNALLKKLLVHQDQITPEDKYLLIRILLSALAGLLLFGAFSLFLWVMLGILEDVSYIVGLLIFSIMCIFAVLSVWYSSDPKRVPQKATVVTPEQRRKRVDFIFISWFASVAMNAMWFIAALLMTLGFGNVIPMIIEVAIILAGISLSAALYRFPHKPLLDETSEAPTS